MTIHYLRVEKGFEPRWFIAKIYLITFFHILQERKFRSLSHKWLAKIIKSVSVKQSKNNRNPPIPLRPPLRPSSIRWGRQSNLIQWGTKVSPMLLFNPSHIWFVVSTYSCYFFSPGRSTSCNVMSALSASWDLQLSWFLKSSRSSEWISSIALWWIMSDWNRQ